MQKVSLLAIDISRQVFSLHGVDERGKAVLKKTLKRSELASFIANFPVCTIVMESCGGCQYWARVFKKSGHTVKLISPQFVKPFLKSNKNDANDAEAIAEAAQHPSMRFVPIKNLGQLELQFLHRVRQRLIESRTTLICQMRGLQNEYGVILSKSSIKFKKELAYLLAEEEKTEMSRGMREVFFKMLEELNRLENEIGYYDGELMVISATDEDCKRLNTIPGVGHITATAIVSAIGNPKNFQNGRQFAAWLGLVPRQHSTGGRNTLLGISKKGDRYLRYLLIHGARAALAHAKRKRDRTSKWAIKLSKKSGHNRAVVALANKNARIIWNLLAKKETYKLTYSKAA
jgi:transposase